MMMKATLARTWRIKREWVTKTNSLSVNNPTQLLFLIHTHTHLQRDDNHEDLLFLVRQDVFNESPAGANQCQCDEQECPLEPGKYIEYKL